MILHQAGYRHGVTEDIRDQVGLADLLAEDRRRLVRMREHVRKFGPGGLRDWFAAEEAETIGFAVRCAEAAHRAAELALGRALASAVAGGGPIRPDLWEAIRAAHACGVPLPSWDLDLDGEMIAVAVPLAVGPEEVRRWCLTNLAPALHYLDYAHHRTAASLVTCRTAADAERLRAWISGREAEIAAEAEARARAVLAARAAAPKAKGRRLGDEEFDAILRAARAGVCPWPVSEDKRPQSIRVPMAYNGSGSGRPRQPELSKWCKANLSGSYHLTQPRYMLSHNGSFDTYSVLSAEDVTDLSIAKLSFC